MRQLEYKYGCLAVQMKNKQLNLIIFKQDYKFNYMYVTRHRKLALAVGYSYHK